MEIGLVLLQFAHIATGAAWFGASVFANVAVLPFLATQPPARQRELVSRLILGPERILIAAALGAAVTGLVRGIAFGRIESVGCTRDAIWGRLARLDRDRLRRLCHRRARDQPCSPDDP